MAALSITTSIVTSIVTVPAFGFTADSIEGGHDLYQQARSLLDQIAGSCDAQTCNHLTNSMSAELDAIEGQLVESGYDRSRIDSFIAHLEASVKQTITLLADDEARQQRGRDSRQWALETFAPTRLAEQMMQMYRGVVGEE